MKYWLMKSEPDVFSIQDLEQKRREPWDGVRNYQARNFMRDDMRPGDLVLFYHSNAKPPGIAGLARICSEAYPDSTAWNPKSPYFDRRSIPQKPVWVMVDVEHVRTFPRLISREELAATPGLSSMRVLRKGMRLSIQPVTAKEFQGVCRLADRGG